MGIEGLQLVVEVSIWFCEQDGLAPGWIKTGRVYRELIIKKFCVIFYHYTDVKDENKKEKNTLLAAKQSQQFTAKR